MVPPSAQPNRPTRRLVLFGASTVPIWIPLIFFISLDVYDVRQTLYRSVQATQLSGSTLFVSQVLDNMN